MKQRTPVYVTISIILVILFIVYYMFVQNSSFLASPYFWGTVVISSILALIHHAIGDLIENDKFKKLTQAEQAEYLQAKNCLLYTSQVFSLYKIDVVTHFLVCYLLSVANMAHNGLRLGDVAYF